MNLPSYLSGIPPFLHLTPSELDQLLAESEIKRYPAHLYLFQQGESPHSSLYLLLSGMVEITIRTDGGKEKVAGTRKKGDLFGETGVLANKPYAASVKTTTEVICLLIKKDTLTALLSQNASFAGALSLTIMEHLRELFEEITHDDKGGRHMGEEMGRRRASEIMSRPVITCGEEETVEDMIRKMSEKRISALVMVNGEGEMKGLITEKDLLHKKLFATDANRNATGNGPIAKALADPDPVTVKPESYYYQILLSMIKKQAKHAVVVMGKEPIGMITYRDLLRMRNLDFLQITERIGEAQRLEDLLPLPELVDRQLLQWSLEKAPIPQILDLVTEFYDQLTAKLIQLSLKEMEPDWGLPPLSFCWLTMGSSGRREQYMRTDQDNGLLYEKTEDSEIKKRAEEFFAHLSHLVVEGLVRLGFARCPGNVMATNPVWRGDWKDFREKAADWIHFPAGEHLRNLTIFLDFRPLYGDDHLAATLRQEIHRLLSQEPISFRFLGEDAVKGRVPVGLFGKPVGEKSGPHRDELDLKGSATVYLTDSVRLLALEAGMETTNTLERIEQLAEKGILPADFSQELKESFETLLRYRIELGLRETEKGRKPTSYLPLKGLPRSDHARLSRSLQAIEHLVEILKFKYHIT
ncbi:DUF294 nucleotidyltransferase-like domain-containing protein [Thermicanus aegyptius]|uniref:DUF294 nucleotidyltransferase-like domain-containing protein n=1 Tax=Thermicanus aegyptius TaxID=94009 RepID=UPI00042820DF|nr:DUF294 nucleotidyltransferase-like domain-containing protein [Thermicanus aegyptius]